LEHSVEVGHECLLVCGSVMWYLDPHSEELDGIVSNEWDGLSIYQELRVYQSLSLSHSLSLSLCVCVCVCVCDQKGSWNGLEMSTHYTVVVEIDAM